VSGLSSTTRPLRLAVVGAGWAGHRQAQAAAELDSAIEVTCLVDNDADQARIVAAELGIGRTTTDLNAVLADPDIDAVSICTPHRLHGPMTIAAARAGKHVLVEKPMACTVAEASAMIDAADEARVRLVVAENQVYEPSTRGLAELVRSGGGIGRLAFAAVVDGYRAPDPSYEGRRAWLTQPDAGGTGTWMLQGIHTVARMRYVLGEVASVYVREHRTPSFRRPDLEATMSGLLVLDNGLTVWLVQTPEVALPARQAVQLYGDEGVVFSDANGYEQRAGAGAASQRFEYPAQELSSYALELQAFADEIATGRPAPTAARSERRSLAVIEAGVESARRGAPVSLAERYPGI